MRVMWGLGCLSIATDCALRASGLEEQHLLSPDALWVWWIFVPFWLLGAWQAFTAKLASE